MAHVSGCKPFEEALTTGVVIGQPFGSKSQPLGFGKIPRGGVYIVRSELSVFIHQSESFLLCPAESTQTWVFCACTKFISFKYNFMRHRSLLWTIHKSPTSDMNAISRPSQASRANCSRAGSPILIISESYRLILTDWSCATPCRSGIRLEAIMSTSALSTNG